MIQTYFLSQNKNWDFIVLYLQLQKFLQNINTNYI